MNEHALCSLPSIVSLSAYPRLTSDLYQLTAHTALHLANASLQVVQRSERGAEESHLSSHLKPPATFDLFGDGHNAAATNKLVTQVLSLVVLSYNYMLCYV